MNNIQHLRYAVEIERVGSINKAAENLYMGQPNLSRAVKELEASIGITIFKRTPRGMVPTRDGEKFLASAKKVLYELDELEREWSAAAGKRQRLSVYAPSADYISAAFAEFSRSLDISSSELYYEEAGVDAIIRNVCESDNTLGIVRFTDAHAKYYKSLFEEKELDFEPIASYKPRLIISSRSRLCELDTISVSDLEDYIKITYANAPAAWDDIKRSGDDPSGKRVLCVSERAARAELLATNPDTFAVDSPVTKSKLSLLGLTEREISDLRITWNDFLICPRGHKISDFDIKFKEALTRCAATL